MRSAFRSLILFTILLGAIATAAPARAMDGALAAYGSGTIVIKTAERRLYLLTGNGEPLSYPVAVGKPGAQWTGQRTIDGKYIRPAWQAPADLRRAGRPSYYPGGSPGNPMGAAALTLSGGLYAIHGTNNPGSIGQFASSGCIRMHNRDIMDLYQRVRVGTRVVVLP
jgi:lipoprotein-anchoring transpeptidase ErfK/SrfK